MSTPAPDSSPDIAVMYSLWFSGARTTCASHFSRATHISTYMGGSRGQHVNIGKSYGMFDAVVWCPRSTCASSENRPSLLWQWWFERFGSASLGQRGRVFEAADKTGCAGFAGGVVGGGGNRSLLLLAGGTGTRCVWCCGVSGGSKYNRSVSQSKLPILYHELPADLHRHGPLH